ncbi:MAG: hypothetical protein U0787_18655 [Polyangia bacterium]
MFGAASPATQSDPVEEALLGLLPPKDESPETLHRAMHHAVFSGGKRIRPRAAFDGGFGLCRRRRRDGLGDGSGLYDQVYPLRVAGS